MKKFAFILAAACTWAWGAEEVKSYSEGQARVGEDGWVLLCYGADWDSTHDESWMRRQTAISSAIGGAMLLYVPVYQNPTPEQAEESAKRLRGLHLQRKNLRSIPCAVLLDAEGRPYATISGDDFTERAAGMIRQKQAQLRTRCSLMRRAAHEEGAARAQTLSSIYRLNIAPPPGLDDMMYDADPEDSIGIVKRAVFDPWALAERISSMPWEEAIAELDLAAKLQLVKEERQALLAIRIGCIHHHLGVAGARTIRSLAAECSDLAPGTALGKAAARAAECWGMPLDLETGWASHQLPRVQAECEVACAEDFARPGEYRIILTPTGGQDALRVTRAVLYDGSKKVGEDIHDCVLKAGGTPNNNVYMLIVQRTPVRPRLMLTFDQQGKTDTSGQMAIRYISPESNEVILEESPSNKE